MSRKLKIEGGAIGLSLAYHLLKRGAVNATILERNQPTSGTSWHAARIVGPLRAMPNMTQFVVSALKAETGMSTGYHPTEGYWLARDPSQRERPHRRFDT